MVKNKTILSLLKIISPWIPKHKNSQKRILVISTTGLGDTLWATPSLESLRASFPDAFIGALSSQVGCQVLKNHPAIDRLYLLKEPLTPRFFSLWWRLFREKFDTILIFHTSERLVLPLASLLGASTLIGTKGRHKGLDTLLTSSLEDRFQHEIVRRLKIIEKIGAKPIKETLSFFLEKEEAKTHFLPQGLWIALHPGAKDGFKRWPLTSYQKLGKKLTDALSCNLLITGSVHEKKLVEELHRSLPNAHIVDPSLSISSLAVLLSQVDLLITNDTGPLHLAAALNIPVLGIFASTYKELSGLHLAPKGAVIERRPSCSPCIKRKCSLPFCFLQMSPDEVFEKAILLLKQFPKGVVQ